MRILKAGREVPPVHDALITKVITSKSADFTGVHTSEGLSKLLVDR
jgi:hypothetical protein